MHEHDAFQGSMLDLAYGQLMTGASWIGGAAAIVLEG